MHTRPVSLASARSGRSRLFLSLALVLGALSACSGDDEPRRQQPDPEAPGLARIEVAGTHAEPGQELRFRCAADDPQGGPLTYQFDFGDGEGVIHYLDAVPSGQAFELDHVFLEEGAFQARCRAVDAEGHEGPWSNAASYSIQRPQPGEGRVEVRVEVFGRGTVTSTPWRLDCPGNCRGWFDLDSELTLTATPEEGWRFVGWWGSGCEARGREVPHSFQLRGQEFCLARFAPEAESSAEWRRTGARLPRSPVWSPEGTRLAALDSPASDTNRLRVWDAASGHLVKELSAGTWARGFHAVAWSPAGDRVALGRADGSITLVDALTWATVREWNAHSGRVRTLAWSPDGGRLASADDKNRAVLLWDASTGARVGTSLAPVDKARRLAWSPDGRRIALEAGPALVGTEWQPWVEIHGVGSGLREELHTNAASFTWSQDGSRYAVGGVREVRVHESATHRLQTTVSTPTSTVSLLDWSPDGRWFGVGDVLGALFVLEADTGAVVVDASGEARRYESLRFHPSKPELAAAKQLPAAVDVLTFDAAARTVSTRELLPHTYDVHAVAWSPAGDRLASSGDEGLVHVWDRQGAWVRTLSGHAGSPVRALAWDASGTRLFSGGADGQVRVWNVADGTPARAPLPHVNGDAQPTSVEVHLVSPSPDARRLATVSESKPDFTGIGTVRVWDLDSGAEVFRFPRRARWVRALSWTSDGRYLVAADSDASWELWDSETGEVRRVDPGVEAQTQAIALSPDGARLALGSQYGMTVRDVRTGELLGSAYWPEVTFSDLNPYAVAWSPDGRRLAGGGVGGLVFSWDVEAGLAPSVIGFHAGHVNTVSWRADGRAVTTGGSDAALSTWRLAP